MPLYIGYAQDIITPPLDSPVFLAGFGQNRRAETVHDNLYARALALRTEKAALVLVALDLVGFFRPDVQDVIQRARGSQVLAAAGLNPVILIASTHTHHGPDTMGMWGPDDKTCGVDAAYIYALKDKIVAVILDSLVALQPAALKVASVHLPGLAKNARNPEIVDDELTVAQFVHLDNGITLANLFNFPCHPEVLWEHNPHISADYPGALRRQVEAATGAPCVFFSGALGGMMTPDVRDHSFEETEQMGNRLSEAGLRVLGVAALDLAPAISLQKREVKVKLTNILFKLAFWRKLLPDVRDRKGVITTEVNLVKIGSLWLATVPGELLPRLGLSLKADLRAAGAQVAGVIGLTNDELGYILPREDFRYPLNPFNPGSHYEETMSVSKEMGPKIVDAVRSLI